jgi:hypothetical protein
VDDINARTTLTGSLIGDAQGEFVGGAPGGAFDPWSYRDEGGTTGADLVGYTVVATDGTIGRIDSASADVDSSFLVVDTGHWVFGQQVMLPAGVVDTIDHDARTVTVDRSKGQIKAAPAYDESSHSSPEYRSRLGGYYGSTYEGQSHTPPPGPQAG